MICEVPGLRFAGRWRNAVESWCRRSEHLLSNLFAQRETYWAFVRAAFWGDVRSPLLSRLGLEIKAGLGGLTWYTTESASSRSRTSPPPLIPFPAPRNPFSPSPSREFARLHLACHYGINPLAPPSVGTLPHVSIPPRRLVGG